MADTEEKDRQRDADAVWFIFTGSIVVCCLSIVIAAIAVAHRKEVTVRPFHPWSILTSALIGTLWVCMTSVSGGVTHVADFGPGGCRAASVLTYVMGHTGWVLSVLWNLHVQLQPSLGASPTSAWWGLSLLSPIVLIMMWGVMAAAYGFTTPDATVPCLMRTEYRTALLGVVAINLIQICLFIHRAKGVHPMYRDSRGAFVATGGAAALLVIVGLVVASVDGPSTTLMLQAVLIIASSGVVLLFTVARSGTALGMCTTSRGAAARLRKDNAVVQQLMVGYDGNLAPANMITHFVHDSEGMVVDAQFITSVARQVANDQAEKKDEDGLVIDDTSIVPIGGTADTMGAPGSGHAFDQFNSFLIIVQQPDILNLFLRDLSSDGRSQGTFLNQWMQVAWRALSFEAVHGTGDPDETGSGSKPQPAVEDRRAISSDVERLFTEFLTPPFAVSDQTLYNGCKEDSRMLRWRDESVEEAKMSGDRSKRTVTRPYRSRFTTSRIWGCVPTCILRQCIRPTFFGHPFIGINREIRTVVDARRSLKSALDAILKKVPDVKQFSIDSDSDGDGDGGGVSETKEDDGDTTTTSMADVELDDDKRLMTMDGFKLEDFVPGMPTPEDMKAALTEAGSANVLVADFYTVHYFELALHVAIEWAGNSITEYDCWVGRCVKAKAKGESMPPRPNIAVAPWNWRVLAPVAFIVYHYLFAREWSAFVAKRGNERLDRILGVIAIQAHRVRVGSTEVANDDGAISGAQFSDNEEEEEEEDSKPEPETRSTAAAETLTATPRPLVRQVSTADDDDGTDPLV